jgi:hypothetical protein
MKTDSNYRLENNKLEDRRRQEDNIKRVLNELRCESVNTPEQMTVPYEHKIK